MRRELAIKAQMLAIAAIVKLNTIAQISDDWDAKDLQLLKKGIGLSIGKIETDLLAIIYEQYPDLDDLK